MECEDHDPLNRDRNFDVESVKKEIIRELGIKKMSAVLKQKRKGL